jgi:hypothetical protein
MKKNELCTLTWSNVFVSIGISVDYGRFHQCLYRSLRGAVLRFDDVVTIRTHGLAIFFELKVSYLSVGNDH